MARKEIHEVFTPRNEEVNDEMYVHRPEFERELLRSLKKNIHTLIFGNSGNGKSWLYKKVLKSSGIPFVVANCANAVRKNSITREIFDAVLEAGYTRQDIDPEASVEPLLTAFKEFSEGNNNKRIVVLDNLESIFANPILMEELANLIILLDDTRYARYNVNFLVVGVPNGVLDYFSKTEHLDSVANRLEELTKVGGLKSSEVDEFVRKGFEQLDIRLSEESLIHVSSHIFQLTLGIAQRVHEYCEALAYEIEDNGWNYSSDLVEKAEMAWLKKGLRKSYSVVQYHLNSRDTTVARRNQVIFAIGKLTRHQFDSGDIDAKIRTLFPETVPSTNMGIGSILAELSSGVNPILNRNEKSNEYVVRDPRYITCIRIMLYEDPITKKVLKRGFNA